MIRYVAVHVVKNRVTRGYPSSGLLREMEQAVALARSLYGGAHGGVRRYTIGTLNGTVIIGTETKVPPWGEGRPRWDAPWVEWHHIDVIPDEAAHALLP